MLRPRERQRVVETIKEVLRCAQEVLEDLGNGWSEAVYQKAMEIALRESGIQYENQFELKHETSIRQDHLIQVKKYIKALKSLSGKGVTVYERGFVINFQKSNNMRLEKARGFPREHSPLKFLSVKLNLDETG